MNIQFGTGVLYGLPNAGNTATDPTPYQFGVLQEASVEFKADLKKLFGQNQFPVAKARGKIEVNCKAKVAVVDAGMFNQLYFGQVQTSGMTIMAVDEADTVASGTVTVTNAAHFLTDFGVQYTATGQQFLKLPTGSPAQGQYTVNTATGVYTFNTGDNAAGVNISYTYSASTRGTTVTLTNQLMGYAPEFQAFLFNQFRTKLIGLQLNDCTMGAMSIPTKQEDFWMSDITFDASVDSSGTLGYIYADVA